MMLVGLVRGLYECTSLIILIGFSSVMTSLAIRLVIGVEYLSPCQVMVVDWQLVLTSTMMVRPMLDM